MSEDKFDAMKAQKVCAVVMPLLDGKVCWETWFQLREEEMILAQLDIGWRIDPIVVAGCSAIHIARNDLVAAALDRGAEAIMWIDGDINWSSGAICRFLMTDVDIVAAAVRRKEPEVNWNVRWLDPADIRVHEEKQLIEVQTIGTGFMMTKRRVYELLAERLGPEYRYISSEDGKERVAFFEAPQSWGEDTRFCHLWRSLVGGKVWVDPAITTQHVIAPRWSAKGKLADWLAERDAEKDADVDRVAAAVRQLREGGAVPETFVTLWEAWGNGAFAATPDLLAGLYDLAKRADGPILEMGSGISTLVMAIANPNVEVHALEHDPSWQMRISRLLSKCGVTNARVHISDMRAYDDAGLFYTVDVLPEGGFAMVLMDGPPRHVGNRAIAYDALGARIEGAVLAVDDTQDPHERKAMDRYLAGRVGELGVYGNDMKQFSIWIPESRQDKEAA